MTLQLEQSNPDDQRMPPGPSKNYDTALIAAIIVAGLVLLGLIGFVLVGDDDGGFELADPPGTTTVTVEPAAPVLPSSTATTVGPTTVVSPTTEAGPIGSSSTAATTTPTTAAPTATPDPTAITSPSSATVTTSPAGPNDVIWPDRNESSGFESPADAAHSFAVDLVGFREPTLGRFQAGDDRSGEVEVRPSPDGPITTVLLRQIEDDSWWVIGAVTEDIVVDQPTAGDRIGGVLRLTGRARAFEGRVDVSLVLLGDDGSVIDGVVIGSGDGELGEFTEDFDLPSGIEGRAVILLVAPSAEDGSAWAATALPIRIG